MSTIEVVLSDGTAPATTRPPEAASSRAGRWEVCRKYVGVATDFSARASTKKVAKALLAECLGTCFLLLFGCGSCSKFDQNHVAQVSVMWGFTVATVVWTLGHLSGAHINPAVTLAMAVTRKIGPLLAVGYAIAQILGAILGATILFTVTIKHTGTTTYVNSITPGLDIGRALLLEMSVTFVLLLCVFATSDPNRTDHHGSGAWALGVCVTVLVAIGMPYTGPSMNPARSIGPAIVENTYTNLYVFCLGPCIGAVLGGLLYEFILSADAEKRDECSEKNCGGIKSNGK